MKKLILVVAGLVMSFTLCFSQSRENILKVYNWADYIDEDLIGEFEQWYEQQSGKPVKIVYQLFDINEIMLSKIERGHEDFDVVCPSDYIIERMLRADLLLPIDKNFPDSINWMGHLSPYIVEQFNKVDGYGKNANDYAVGYMW
ncbi:MAG: spermidine/putrescine ABC transporter, partial [Bacteroidales bacterium]|nr:spermidine/putrescine ABC transporter [Bacteroidales bacterium]